MRVGRDDIFFSSRRRHTRFKCDWSSDVCSSDLGRTLTDEEMQHLASASDNALKRLASAPKLDHLERNDRADALATWLESQRVEDAWEYAPAFVEAGLAKGGL